MEDNGLPIRAVVSYPPGLLHDVEITLVTKREKIALSEFESEYPDIFSRGARKLFRMACKSRGCKKRTRWWHYIFFFNPQNVNLRIYVEGRGFEEIVRRELKLTFDAYPYVPPMDIL